MFLLTWRLTDGSSGHASFSTEAAAAKAWHRATFSQTVQRVRVYEVTRRDRFGRPGYKLVRWANLLTNGVKQ
jgi:hypothetical protein